MQKEKEGVVSVRLSEEEIRKLDAHTTGGLSRAQVIRVALQMFLDRSEKERREILVSRLIGGK